MKTYTKEQQRQNIAKVGLLVLHQEERKFDMRTFETFFAGECKTSCCLIGFGPLAEIQKGVLECWWEYADRVYGTHEREESYTFLFDISWPSKPEEAARRVLHYLDHWVPAKWNYRTKFNEDLGTPELVRRLKAHAGPQ